MCYLRLSAFICGFKLPALRTINDFAAEDGGGDGEVAVEQDDVLRARPRVSKLERVVLLLGAVTRRVFSPAA